MAENNLAQMGAARVETIDSGDSSWVVKTNASRIECDFYADIAGQLERYGVRSPRVQHVDTAERVITLEALTEVFVIGNPVPTGVLTQLATLHSIVLPQRPWHLFANSWTDQKTEHAARLLKLDSASQRRLQWLQSLSTEIFGGQSLLSGDSNMGNWGRRANGELVQFDWERFSLGHPAIDLAPLIPGLPDWQRAKAFAVLYLQENIALNEGPEELARHILISIAWLVIDVLNLLALRRHPLLTRYCEGYSSAMPDWLELISAKI